MGLRGCGMNELERTIQEVFDEFPDVTRLVEPEIIAKTVEQLAVLADRRVHPVQAYPEVVTWTQAVGTILEANGLDAWLPQRVYLGLASALVDTLEAVTRRDDRTAARTDVAAARVR